ncbi:CDP-glycerol glycerophosphotransferase family protein, partial [archaeon]|nr:CDP-glycerol glycerophosphotransferase family protein [archaeon]
MAKRVWAVAKDPGGTNGVLPVVKVLRERGVHVDLIAHGKAPELAQVKELGTYLVAGHDPQNVLDTLPLPDAYITSMCSEGSVGRSLIPLMRERGIPTIGAQDFWGGHLISCFSNPVHQPDYIWVNDELGADVVQRAWSGFDREQIWVTGFPAMDKYAQVDVKSTRQRVRMNLQLEEESSIVLFAGQLQGTGQLLGTVVNALNILTTTGVRVAFAPRQHPRMPNNAPWEMPLWEEALARFRVGQLLDTSIVSTPEMVAAADVVV